MVVNIKTIDYEIIALFNQLGRDKCRAGNDQPPGRGGAVKMRNN
jgi:hypothetical protein